MDVKYSITGLASRVSAIRRTSSSRVVVGVAVDLDLEPLALADVADALEPEPWQCSEHGLALGIEDLALGHHVDDVSGHGGAFRGRLTEAVQTASV